MKILSVRDMLNVALKIHGQQDGGVGQLPLFMLVKWVNGRMGLTHDTRAGEIGRLIAQAQRENLGTQKTGALSTLESAFGRSQKQATTSTTEAETSTERAKAKALSNAQGVQRQNRNALRALGILSSSAAGEMLAKPIAEYGRTAADLEQGLIQRKDYINNWLQERMEEHQSAVKDIEQQYAQLIGNIDRDLRFNDRQRTNAVRQAQAALSQRMSEIQQSSQQYQMAAQQYQAGILQQVAQLQLYQNPQADTSGIQSTLLSNAGLGQQQPRQLGITQTEEQRRRQLQQQSPTLSAIR